MTNYNSDNAISLGYINPLNSAYVLHSYTIFFFAKVTIFPKKNK